MKTRSMDVEDIEAVCQIEKLCFPIPWSYDAFLAEIEQNKFARYMVLELDGSVIGYGGMWNILDEGHITNIAIHPEASGYGYGNMLVKGLIEMAQKEDINRITLEVRVSNKIAQNLYKKYGFKDCGIRPKYYEDNGEDAMIMWRE
ncbi:ribosomal protein S18-alanine N-acetyltransferase [Marinisporobacter balticus]|uniref:[Ribosomal protein bS18]-alanine N-acetyltransferase n=2 Tax=Marinisporobacter balticus TaxID=2018667 RepID=A0A4V2SBV3_9FIRM|nr:[SSU ribosomal protein S18P]-alanine acetyltransferase [Marinisporobacter balticus]